MSVKPKSAMGFIFVTLLIDFTGFGIIIPGLPALIMELTNKPLAAASEYAGLLTASYAAIQFVAAPVIGALSDRFGRRPVLLMSLFGLGVDYIFLSFAHNIAWLFAGRIVAGFAGASFTTAQAYIADITPPEKRAQNFGLVGAAFGIGFVLGPVIGGLASQFGLRVPFMIAAGLSLLNWLYGYFVLPESLAKDKRREFSWLRANPIGSFLNLSRYKSLIGLLVGLFLLYFAAHAVQSNWSFFTTEKFKWTANDIGFSLGFVGIVIGLVQGVLIRYINPKIGNVNSVYVGLSLYVVSFVLFGFASQSWMMYAFMVPYGLAGIGGPAMQAIISKEVPANAQGEMQGLLTGLMSLASLVGPIVMLHIFAWSIAKTSGFYFPGAAFILAAFFTLVALIISYFTLKKHHS